MGASARRARGSCPPTTAISATRPQLPLPDVTPAASWTCSPPRPAHCWPLCAACWAPPLTATRPGWRTRLSGEVERRILTPYRTEHFWWMGRGDEPMWNWTPVVHPECPAGRRASAPRLRRCPPMCGQAAYSLDCFLKDYGDGRLLQRGRTVLPPRRADDVQRAGPLCAKWPPASLTTSGLSRRSETWPSTLSTCTLPGRTT